MTPEPLDVMIEQLPSGAAGPALVTPLGNDQYRIEGDTLCFFVAEDPREWRRAARCGDVVEARAIDDHTLGFVKVVTRARLRRLQFLITPAVAQSSRLERVLARVMELGGYWDRVFGGIVTIHLPRDCQYDPLAELIATPDVWRRACERAEAQRSRMAPPAPELPTDRPPHALS